MGLRKHVLYLAAAGLMAGPAFAATAGESTFTALQNVEAQGLSQDEMQAIAGQLNAIDIGNDLLAAAAKATNPLVKGALTKLGNWYLANADSLNALFMKWGVYTAPK
jgi:hypothetical protein